MTRSITFCLLVLTAVIAFIREVDAECIGCMVDGKCRESKESWTERKGDTCATKLCQPKVNQTWRVFTKKVSCLKEDGKCVGKGTTWTTMKGGKCWTHECIISPLNKVTISSKVGGKC
uniref:Uncharacterized protein n=1 Tax=Octopus bimaculoides TaxID=37653 RepID=A0A0L8IDP9_OCTBM